MKNTPNDIAKMVENWIKTTIEKDAHKGEP